jgi:ATP-dependent DNA helicase RecQ
VGLLTYFIDQIVDPAEKERSWQRYHEVRRYAESAICRHRQICVHFGEIPKWKSCGACDVCGVALEWLSEAVATPVRRPEKAIAQVSDNGRFRRTEAVVSQPVADLDLELREHLREWRRTMAKKQGIPAFVVMHDTSLEQLCRLRPHSLAGIREIHGFGERKTEMYGREIIEAIQQFSSHKKSTAETRRRGEQ